MWWYYCIMYDQDRHISITVVVMMVLLTDYYYYYYQYDWCYHHDLDCHDCGKPFEYYCLIFVSRCDLFTSTCCIILVVITMKCNVNVNDPWLLMVLLYLSSNIIDIILLLILSFYSLYYLMIVDVLLLLLWLSYKCYWC